MSEGGVYPWKRQSGNTVKIADYSNLQNPLPKPPKGSAWFRDPDTREWKVVEIQQEDTNSIVTGNVNDVESTRKARSLLPEDSDFLSHEVQKTDTLQGLCLKYHTTPTQLRQLNRFSGSNLALAPKILVIPLKQSKAGPNVTKKSPEQEKESKINSFLLAFRFSKNRQEMPMGRKEAVAYLEMNDFNLEEAIADAKDDLGWEVSMDSRVVVNEESALLSV